ncbi:MAG: mannonate dehydratase [Candidatus Latescibacteria bacterium]|jgi:mannonate dehydratase|nr:mannonate dehydratase [Candidatus Latescibacterota bacterium]
MYIAHQITPTDTNLKFLKQIGVEHVISSGPNLNDEGCWAYEDIVQLKSGIESAGLQLVGLNNIIGTPGLKKAAGSGFRGGHAQDQILLAGQGRDEQIEKICQSIRNTGQAGITRINYGFILTGVWRTSRDTKGRGGAHVTAFDYEQVKDAPLTEAGEVSAEEMWSRFTYFLERVIPVAEEAGVNMACHPHDPPIPNLGGDPRILGSVEGYRRLIETVPSERNGLNFCQGTIAEMGTDVVEAIHYFGSRNKIFNVHFRNIRGTASNFSETFVDDGDVDMLETLKAYHDVGYRGPVVPDHLPNITVDDTNLGSLGYALGYMKGMLRAIE